MKMSRPNCYQCHHFYITWDASFPYGCKAFKMKSKRIPSLEVFDASKEHCHLYKTKQKEKKPDNPGD